MFAISKDKIDELFALIGEKQPLYLPVDNNTGKADFKKWEKGVKLSSNLKTVRSAKDFFFPQTETLMAFKTDGRNIEVIDTRESKGDFVVFGVRGCDVKSIEVLDKVFLAEPVDSYYQDRREHGVIVSMACSRPVETCFCQTFGIDATNPAWIASGRAIPCEYGIYPLNERDTKVVKVLAE